MNNFIATLRGEKHDRVPVWFMRQAGRYLPDYVQLRKKKTIKEICQDPEAISRVSYSPVRVLGVDAAIIFSDILLPLESMGFRLEYNDSLGPLLSPLKNLNSVMEFDQSSFVYPLSQSVKKFREEHPEIPLIGFTGGPLTLSSYMIAGKSDRDLEITKSFAMKNDALFHRLLKISFDAIVKLARLQIGSGANVIQIFDSWAGSLPPSQFRDTYLGFLEELRNELNFPLIYFSTGTAGIIDEISRVGFDFLSVDSRVDIAKLGISLDKSIGLQGNLDPVIVENSPGKALHETQEILSSIGKRERYIFSLGHGVLPGTDPDTLKSIVEEVHSFDR